MALPRYVVYVQLPIVSIRCKSILTVTNKVSLCFVFNKRATCDWWQRCSSNRRPSTRIRSIPTIVTRCSECFLLRCDDHHDDDDDDGRHSSNRKTSAQSEADGGGHRSHAGREPGRTADLVDDSQVLGPSCRPPRRHPRGRADRTIGRRQVVHGPAGRTGEGRGRRWWRRSERANDHVQHFRSRGPEADEGEAGHT